MTHTFRAVKRGAHYIGVVAALRATDLDGVQRHAVAVVCTARKHPTWQRAYDDARHIARQFRRRIT